MDTSLSQASILIVDDDSRTLSRSCKNSCKARRKKSFSQIQAPSDTLILDRERSTAAFRIFQELLTNVARHANATRIDVAMRVDSGVLVLTVEDNGKGIAESAIHDWKSLGLLGMRERVLPFGAAMEITGTQDKGTKVRVSIPLGLK